jgi:hypothetical protein
VTHGFHTEEELRGLTTRSPASLGSPPSAPAGPQRESELAKLHEEIESLKERTAALERDVAELKKKLPAATP